MKRACYKRKADRAKGNSKTGRSGRDGAHGGGPPARAALVFTDSAGHPDSGRVQGSTSGSSTRVLELGATNHIAARFQGFTAHAAQSRATGTLVRRESVTDNGHGRVSMDLGKGKTKARMV